MSLIVPNNLTSALSLADPAVLRAAESLGKFAAQIYRQLPDIKKEKNQARSAFERKMAPGNNRSGGVAGNKGAKGKIEDVSTSGSTRVKQRSMTGSYAISSSAGGGGSRGTKANITRSPYLDKISVCFRTSISLTNSALNACSFGYSLAVDSPTTDLGFYMNQLAVLGGIFREFRISKMDVAFVPRLGSTAAGNVAMAVDRDPRTGSIFTTAEIIRRDPFAECDIKQPANITWSPLVAKDKEWKFTKDSGRPVENLSFGTFVLYSSNDQALGAIIGELFVDAWAEYAIPF